MAFEEFEKHWKLVEEKHANKCADIASKNTAIEYIQWQKRLRKEEWEEALRLIIKKWMQKPAIPMSELIDWIKQELGES